MKKSSKKAVVIHSGGMDSSLCLALAIREFGRDNVLSLSFHYGQRHRAELTQAKTICNDWGVEHRELPLNYLGESSQNALTDHQQSVTNQPANTMVVGRNGMMAHIGGIHAYDLGARYLYLGVIEADSSTSGYRDCSREYMDLIQNILRLDFADPLFEIRTPIIKMTKKATMMLAHELGILEYLLQETITCYQGIPHYGCGECLSCRLRNDGIRQFLNEFPDFSMPYQPNIAEAL
jgi:7-cyano-7-deazaguanine synthase